MRRVQAQEQIPVNNAQEVPIQREGIAATTELANPQTGINVDKTRSEESEARTAVAPVENQQVNQPENQPGESVAQELRRGDLFLNIVAPSL